MATWLMVLFIIIIIAAALFGGRFSYVRLKKAEEKLEALQHEYSTLLREQQGITFRFKKIDGKYRYTLADGQLFYKLGLTQADIGKSMEEIMPGHMHAYIREVYDRAWAGERFQYESGFNGYTYLNSVMPIIENGETVEVIVVGSDITERKQAEQEIRESEERYRRLVDLSPDAIVIISENKVVLANQKAIQYLGDGSREKLNNRAIREMIHPDYFPRAKWHLQQVFENKGILPPFESVYLRTDGEPIHVEVIASYMPYNGVPAAMVIFRDITERKRAEQQMHETNKLLSHLASIDGLTGIANRRHFDDSFAKEWDLAVQGSLSLSLILCDIDYFKRYNDTYGHQEGDTCLRLVAGALNAVPLPGGGFVARYGGEEFVALLPETEAAEAEELGRLLGEGIAKLEIPHSASRVSSVVTISIGAATLTPTADMDREMLFRRADTALYVAKQQGRNQMRMYDETLVKEGV
ncbi:sensor domain-containing diguanylate cyclase [Paenibacillus silvisoli]|uniref:sensor domain-containing diguanylate cyclase n=1 Tax=Paenibacillus silvisoli TaxID=3110539 RepID=UPI002805FBFA|nr:diguanylate cyclase [Paenibacillus silvisoli]